MNNVFGLDIGTRNVVGTVGYQTDDKEFVVTAQYVREHETRACLLYTSCSFYQRARMSILSDAGIAAEYFRLEIRAIYAETATA